MVKRDILILQYSEKLKSELIIGLKLIKALENLKNKEFEGGTKIVAEFFEAFSVEVGIAYNVTKDENFKKVYDIIREIDFLDIDNAIDKLSKAISIVTTCAANAYERLKNLNIDWRWKLF